LSGEGPYTSGSRAPFKFYRYGATARTVISAIYSKMALDASTFDIKHVIEDKEGNIVTVVDDSLNHCLNVSANIDQSGPDFVRDVIISMLDEGNVALVPIETDSETDLSAFKVETIRTGKILGWYPNKVRLSVYNDLPTAGKHEEIILDKSTIGILENPLYMVMNQQGSFLQRLITKLNMLDTIDDQSVSGKLDLLMQFPFSIKSEARKQQAENRRAELETQLSTGDVGVAYIDAVEKVIQLNRPVTNTVLAHVEYLTKNVYSQLGISNAVFDGTADDNEMMNYYVRTIKPILKTLTVELTRKFISRTAYSQGHRISYFANPFSFVSPSNISDFIDKSSRNEILTGNELRRGLGYLKSREKDADRLKNKNINSASEEKNKEEGDNSAK
jgi:hypothetical protein